MTNTPAARRSAWVQLMAQVEGNLVATREHARTMAAMSRDLEPAVLERLNVSAAEEWDATAWAADRLLRDLSMILPPEVPLDHTLGQATFLDLEQEEHPLMTLVASSTPGDEPGEGRS
jgi:hypothetical protein